MSSVVISGDTSGAITLSAPAVAGTNTITLPAATGTVMVSGNMPAFSAYQSAAQTPSSGVFTKVQFQTEEFDTANCFDNTTNYRFTPTVSGYYQVNAEVSVTPSTGMYLALYKNGSAFKQGSAGAAAFAVNLSAIVYFNGSTDYIELYVYMGIGTAITASAAGTYFQATLVRAA